MNTTPIKGGYYAAPVIRPAHSKARIPPDITYPTVGFRTFRPVKRGAP